VAAKRTEKTKTADSSDFIVRFEGVDLPKAVRARIAEAIQAAAMEEFVKLDLAPELVPQIPRIKMWAGVHLRFKRIALADKLELPNLQVTNVPNK
jgi:hypothetical protein